MFKRLFFALVGLGSGVTLGIWAVRKLEATSAHLSPQHLTGVAAGRATALRERLVDALDEGRRAASSREAELRLHYRGDSPPEVPAPEHPSTPNAL